MTSSFSRLAKSLNLATPLLCGCFFVYLLTERLTWIWENEYPIATDSFFYLLELRSYSSDGTGTYTSYNPFFLALTGVQLALSCSPETTYNLLVSFNILIVTVALALAASSSPLIVGLLINIAFLASDTLFFRIYAFPQQALSMGLFLLGLAILVLQDGNKRKRLILSVAFLLLSSAFHLTGAALTMIVGLVSVLLCQLPLVLRALMGMIGIALLAGLLWFADRQIFAFSLNELLPGLPKTCDFTSCSAFERLESWLYLAAALILLVQVRGTMLVVTLLSVFFALNAPIWATEGHMAYRLALTSVWLFYLSAALASSLRPTTRLITTLWSVSLLFSYFTFARGAYKDPGISARTLEQHASIVQRWIPPEAVVLAPHGTQFRIRYFWHRKAIGGPGAAVSDEKQAFILTRRRPKRICSFIHQVEQADEHTMQCIQLDRTWSLVKIDR